jgi:predicted metal-dependent peptidase
MKPNKISLLQFDTQIKNVSVLKSVNDLRNVRFEGRGGTLIEPVLNWAVINKPQLLLIFTDGEFYFNDDDPIIKSKVIWLIHNNKRFKAPFGKVIHYEIKG